MNKYDNLSREELEKLVEKQDKELASKKYGLVWDGEREPEQVVLDCANNLPVLKRVKGKEIKTDNSEDNILIEGDNYHALTVLNYTHKRKIDVIYIDPPYNTGNKDFIYNDRYVDKTDNHPHSKWLNFMEKRLKLAKELLKKTGVIFISIDDHEMAQLKLLCNRIFGEDNFINNFMWLHGKGKKTKQVRTLQQYVLCYGKNKHLLEEWVDIKFATGTFSNPDNDKRGDWFSGSVSFSEDRSNKQHKNYFTVKSPSGIEWTRQWQCAKDEMSEYLDDSKIYFGPAPEYSNVPRLKIFPTDSSEIIPNNILDNVGTTRSAQKELDQMIDKNDDGKSKFENPKPPKLIEFFCSIINVGKNIIVLDFMAGSGTTGHAVLELNREDGGNRKFILCTNNELNGFEKELKTKGMSNKEIQEYGICRKITYPRIEKVIKGYKKNGDGEKVEGLGSNLQYFKTGLVKKTSNKDQVRLDLTKKCVEMLCVKENIFNAKIEEQDYKIFSSNKKDKFLCIYFNLFDKSFEDFLKKIKKLNGEKTVYVFSLDNEINKNLFSGIDNLKIEAIPQEIMDVYDKIVKMNIPVKAKIIFTLLEKAKKQIFEENDKDDGAKNLRIVLEKILQKIAQINRIEIYNDKQKEIKISKINDDLKKEKVISQIEWEEIKTYLTIGNKASHGEFDEYDLDQVKSFAKFAQDLINKFNIQ